jgi:hypothetical protein
MPPRGSAATTSEPVRISTPARSAVSSSTLCRWGRVMVRQGIPPKSSCETLRCWRRVSYQGGVIESAITRS